MMKCPKCLSELVPSTLEGYQTLSEHVCHPNDESPLRYTYVCPNGCHDGFYGMWGSLYGSFGSKPELWYAVNSFNWNVENWDLWEKVYKFDKIMEKFKDFILRMETD